jgi:PAS domain S-box-containing protein
MSAQVRDISERKRTQEALKEREARFGAVFNHAIEAIALLDATGRILEINNAAREMLPVDEEVLGKHLWELTWWGTSDSGERAESIDALRTNVMEAAGGNLVRTRSELATSRGVHELDFSLIPVSNEDKEVIYLIAEARKLIES